MKNNNKQYIYDLKGKYLGELRSIDDIKDNSQRYLLEAFSRFNCVIYEYTIGLYGAIPGSMCEIRNGELE